MSATVSRETILYSLSTRRAARGRQFLWRLVKQKFSTKFVEKKLLTFSPKCALSYPQGHTCTHYLSTGVVDNFIHRLSFLWITLSTGYPQGHILTHYSSVLVKKLTKFVKKITEVLVKNLTEFVKLLSMIHLAKWATLLRY